jgi:hypothetical protein
MTQERKNGTRARWKSPIGIHTQLPRKHAPNYRRTQPRGLDYQVETKASLSGDFMALLPMHPYFGNSEEEFHPHETLSTPMKLLSSLSSSIRCHISLFNVHETLMKPHWDWPKDLWQLTLRAGVGGLHIGYILAKPPEKPGSTWELERVIWQKVGLAVEEDWGV